MVEVKTCQSSGMNEDGSTEEGDVVAGVESMPECTEQEHCKRAVTSLVDDVAQPQRCHLVPTV